jgi:hypothetical protein
VDRPDSSVQVLDTTWEFDLTINTTTHMIEHFKARLVANGQPQILGFSFDVHAPTVPMGEIKLLLAILAFRDMELYQMDTTTAFNSALLVGTPCASGAGGVGSIPANSDAQNVPG